MEKISFNIGDQKIVGLLQKSDSKKGVILLHGFTGDKDTAEAGAYPVLADKLHEEGFNVLRIDCRGTKDSDGKFEDMTFDTEVEDLKRSIEYMRGANDRIAVVGASFGGAVAPLAYADNMDCLVLWYPLLYPTESQRFESLKSIESKFERDGKAVVSSSNTGENFTMGKTLYDQWKTIEPSKKLVEIKCPVLIVSGTNDQAISIENVNRAMNELKSEKKVEFVDDSYHCWKNENDEVVDSYREQAVKATVEWIKKWL